MLNQNADRSKSISKNSISYCSLEIQNQTIMGSKLFNESDPFFKILGSNSSSASG